MKTCSHCKQQKAISEFHRNAAMADGFNNYCRPCKAASDREYSRKHRKKLREYGNEWQRRNNDRRRKYSAKYEKTPRGFLVRCYRNMKSRIEGVQKRKHHLYAGKEILPKEEFYRWSISHPEFLSLFAAWEASGYERRLCPSPDRINSDIGYTIENIQWVTMAENSSRTSASNNPSSQTLDQTSHS